MSGFSSASEMLREGGPDGADALFELYHENSKQRRSDRGFIERIVATSASPVLYRMLYSSRKRYRTAGRTVLPSPDLDADAGGGGGGELERLISGRRSRRDFGPRPLALDTVSTLLRLSLAETTGPDESAGRPRGFRAAPSAGALFPLEAYLVTDRVNVLDPGVHHYDPAAHALECVASGPQFATLATATGMDELATAAAMLVLTAIPARSSLKYGERAYRFVLLEAGHVAQNVLLAAEQMGVSACAVGGFVDDEVNAALEIDGVDEISLYLIALGHPASPALTVLRASPDGAAA